MAYNLATDKIREIIYSGGAVYDCRLYFNDSLIPAEQISDIKISSPIIDASASAGTMFHIGTFISQQITIKFRNLNGLDLTSNPKIYLEIGIEVDGEFIYIPIGHYLIDELAENYQSTCEIVCLDYAIKFKPNVDISAFLNEEGYILASDLFERLCEHFGVEAGTYPSTNNDKKIYFYDSTLSGKNYIGFLAELFGGNAKIDRDGKCIIIPLKNDNAPIEIDALTGKKFEVGETYELTRVCYDNGKLKFEADKYVVSVDVLPTEEIDTGAYYYLTPEMKYYTYVSEEWVEATDLKNTLYLRQENLFITQKEDVDNIFNAVNGFKVINVSCEHRGDITLDSWDNLKYTTDKGEYYTLNNNEVTFNGVCMSKVDVNIPAGKKAETTNIINPSTEAMIKRIQTIVNEVEGNVTTVVTKTSKMEQQIKDTDAKIDSTKAEIEGNIEDVYAKKNEVVTTTELTKLVQDEAKVLIEAYKTEVTDDGVKKVDTKTGYTFDTEGLKINKKDAKTSTKLDEKGLDVIDATGSTNESLLFAGFDEETGESIVRSKNMRVEKYLVIGKNSRMEDYVDEKGRQGTGMFWIGG